MSAPAFEEAVNQLAQLLPAERWVPESDRARYAVQGKPPLLAVCPASESEICGLMTLAVRDAWGIVPWGGGTAQGMGRAPAQYDVCLSLERFAGVEEYHPEDMVVTVRAGTKLSDLQAELAAGGQWWPIDPPGADPTVGGLIATNRFGPRRAFYGTARDHVIGMRVLHADGVVTKHGGRVVKNVTGYDLNKLHIGALGTLGIILELSIKLRPLPFLETMLLAAVPSADVGVSACSAIIHAGFTPLACEFLDHALARAIGCDTDSGHVLVSFEGPPAAIERQERDITDILAANGASGIAVRRRNDVTDTWGRIRNFGLAESREAIALWCRASVLPDAAARVAVRAREIAEDHSLTLVTQIHLVNGALRLGVVGRPEPLLAERVVHAWRALMQEYHGSLIVENAPENVRDRIDPWGEPRPDFFLMERLKHSLDPHRLLNRGRYVGGL